MRAYDFDAELASLRMLMAREDHFSPDKRYRPTWLEQLRPLVIYLEDFLREQGVEWRDRRNRRLAILSFIVGEKLDSTYGLTTYQCSTLLDYFFGQDPQRAKQFLADCAQFTSSVRFSATR